MNRVRAAFAAMVLGILLPAPPASAAEPAALSLAWSPCAAAGSSLECATIQVPLDHADPTGPSIDLAISRLPAADPSRRRGVLLVNPGGPGGSGLGLPEYIAQLFAGHPRVAQEFDLIGFDPRFVGRSSPATCGLTGADIAILRWPGAGGFPGEVAQARSIAQRCAAHAGWAIPYATTADAARDMDLIRAALGERKMSYLGYSYGTSLARAYVALFPDRVDRFVLDSNTNPLESGRETFRGFGPAFERMLGLFASAAARDDARYGLGSDARTVRRVVDGLVARAEKEPLPVGEETFTAAELRTLIFRMLYAENRFDYLGRFLSVLRAGQPLPADLAFLVNAGSWEAPPPAPADNAVAGYFLVTCADSKWPTKVGRYRAEQVIDSRAYPFFGPAAANISPCAFWPEIDRPGMPSVAGSRIPSVAGSRVPVLLINSLGDPATPYAGALATRRMMPNARLVTVSASHHAVLGEYPNACVEEAAVGYLLSGRLPMRDLACPA
ncbi:alpha/beta hydrolase [Micromonospora polyrhachis]|uniref:Pimeloyl-ACP methyl ester carboxylesterase n=1 Tax=Micromonospora polyrhachis TaxID=1282883 RepID=A0A7W7SVG3_9ACTN|nr:alpha/beta hydrolase [Micromonospora polyrhachis]MBB4961720.1 pimeloyl-ACP methyl ester carboxylesterase [Micromonospora polyrhachis]